MELKDTIEMMNSDDYKKRYRAEYHQVRIRAEKLQAMLEKYKEGTLPFTPTCSYEMLYTQLIYMNNYIEILIARARVEGINLYK